MAKISEHVPCIGTFPTGYNEIFVYIPNAGEIIRIAEGTGDNLLKEDFIQGYVDYIYYDIYKLDNGIDEIDGGQVLLKKAFREQYRNTVDAIPDVLAMAYGNTETEYVILC